MAVQRLLINSCMSIGMRLEMRLIKEFDNEANMESSRASVISKASKVGYTVLWTVSG